MQPPEKPRRPQPDARALPMARTDIVPGIPKQAPSPKALAAARAASREPSRPSSPEVQDVRIEALGHRVDILEDRLEHVHDGHDEVAKAVGSLVREVGEWKLKAVDSEGVKVREEQKTKRWMAIIGLITMVVAPAGTITANQLTKEAPPVRTEVTRSSMELELEACAKAPDGPSYAACVRDAAVRNAPSPRR
jgi:hypothetical protein